MGKSNRFIVKDKGNLAFGSTTMIVVDIETGVNYLFVQCGYGGGLTPLLDEQGSVIVSKSVAD